MTKKQREEHLENLKSIVKSLGFKEDRWGNFKHDELPENRIKFKKVQFNFEHKLVGNRWMKLQSIPWSKINTEIFEIFLKNRLTAKKN